MIVVLSVFTIIFVIYSYLLNKKVNIEKDKVAVLEFKIKDLNKVVEKLLNDNREVNTELDRAVLAHDKLVFDYNNLLEAYSKAPKVKLFTVKPLEFFNLDFEKSNKNNVYLNELTNYVVYLENILNLISKKYPEIVEGIKNV